MQQYGDTEAFGVFPDWQRQLSKFASVQDRLREWDPSVRAKIQHFSCITIAMLDIDGFRLDKATQITVDAQGEWSDYIRQCASRFGKSNFFIPGEITGGNTFGSIYLGRGKEPEMAAPNLTAAVTMTNDSADSYYIRDQGKNALDAAAFHYTIYRSLTRFLGMDGNLASGYDAPLNWVDAWNTMLLTNDLVNPNTGIFDPRHMYGVTNQDVFRWPAIRNGTQRFLLGLFITTLHMPGIPMLLWGEEQAFYVLDNTADNYIFGRQAMSPALAWETHGCYSLGSVQYYQFPVDSGARGCHDDWNSLDHRDPSAPVRNIIKAMYHMREFFPVLNDGYFLQQLSNQTRQIQYPGSDGVPTETGLWSTLRGRFEGIQNFGTGNQSVWLVYHNDNITKQYTFDCSNETAALIAPFDAGTTVKNLFFPHDEYTLQASTVKLGLEASKEFNGCLPQLDMEAYAFKALVPIEAFIPPPPLITRFIPGHDARLLSQVAPGQQETVKIEFHFSAAMDCDDIRDHLKIESTTEDKSVAQLDPASVQCGNATNTELPDPNLVGALASAFVFQATLVNVSNGVHAITVQNASTQDGKSFSNSIDKFLLRVGQGDNPVVFPRLANYTNNLLHQDANGTFYVSHKAAGADQFRYSLDFGSTYSKWQTYSGGNSTLVAPHWTGTKLQAWNGEHVIVQYWTQMTGSSDYFQHADLNRDSLPPRRFPHLFLHGPFNQYGFDAGVKNQLELDSDARWTINFMTEWPAVFQINVWGMDPDGQPDQSVVLGDVDGDFVLDRMPPSSLAQTVVNITTIPPAPFLAYKLSINDGNYNFQLIPVGSRGQQILMYFLLALVPVATGVFGIWAFMQSFYKVKFNEIGFQDKREMLPLAIRRQLDRFKRGGHSEGFAPVVQLPSTNASLVALPKVVEPPKRRCVLIATMEYDIEDWSIKIKIGGLGVMAQLMGKNLGHQDLIWVVPCVGGITYPVDTPMESMEVTVLGSRYEVKVQKHILKNITYVLLDAPVFRQQTKSEPYPPRMDDLDSAVYYSAWNQCIAHAIRRFPIDLYHINDYHGAVAPLHLLPQTIPVCLSLHNAEFQGLWPMRTTKEVLEVCRVYNLDPEVVERYVQFGDVFNLLHAGSSYLRIHQKGFGAVGVSRKYGKRSYARYPIFWGLNKVGKLPNPDPTDLDEWDGKAPKEEDVQIDQSFEAARADLKRQAQEWAGLDQNPKADLMVFVGRWSMQKGIDLIADIMPSILEDNKNVQLICVGPVIDLYGKFAALKLDRMMKIYPGRVFSKPEFTALPPYIFSGAEFALIPSRDEPFGLVAVEFGRKGALGIGARVGGLGTMPGWWYTVESTTTSHVLQQFRTATKEAIASKPDIRAQMRARSAKQRFPVATWIASLEKLQGSALKIHHKEATRFRYRSRPSSSNGTPSGAATPISGTSTPTRTPRGRMSGFLGSKSERNSQAPSPNRELSPAVQSKVVSLGIRAGPGHEQQVQKGKSRMHSRTVSEEDTEDEEARVRFIDEYTVTREQAQAIGLMRAVESQNSSQIPPIPSLPTTAAGSTAPSMLHGSLPTSPRQYQAGFNPMGLVNARLSTLSLDTVVGEKKDFSLQKVEPFFTDTNGEYYAIFSKKLEKLDGKNSDSELCIEEFLVKSEKKWFDRFREAKLGLTPSPSPASSVYRMNPDAASPSGRGSTTTTAVGSARSSIYSNVGPTPADSISNVYLDHMDDQSRPDTGNGPGPSRLKDEFLLGDNYVPPTGLKKMLQYRIGDWPIYSFFLAFGQIIAANSYQITLLTGAVGQTAEKLYVVASIYLITSIIWWFVFRKLASVYVLSLPFVFYGLAFFFLGITPWVYNFEGRGWVQNVATGLYATASSSGSLYFALNFGDEGGAPVKAWVYRACVIQGTQQIYVVGLWYWGSTLTKATEAGAVAISPVTNTWVMTAITIPIACLLWFIGYVIFVGLPDYYCQAPGSVPSFYKSLMHRKIILWFFVVVIIQNYWLSAPYGRNWSYLWSSNHAKAWQIVLLIFFFFIGIWAAWLALFGFLSTSHSWILPLFAIGLGAPRWCQILWATSNIGFYLPWAGGPVASALLGRGLWLWLGVLDALQGVGFGMILLQTLTRIHIAFTLIAAQVLGSAATILARATAPNKIGPGDVFPDFSGGPWEGVTKLWFWVALTFQLVVCVGFFLFFRKEQLTYVKSPFSLDRPCTHHLVGNLERCYSQKHHFVAWSTRHFLRLSFLFVGLIEGCI